jgi:hypothetical protein
MNTLVAAPLIDWSALGQIVLISLLVGVGAVVVFSLLVGSSVTYSLERARGHVTATPLALSIVYAAVLVAVVVIGINAMLNK